MFFACVLFGEKQMLSGRGKGMEITELAQLYQLSARRVRETSLTFSRHLYSSIDWENRLIALMGARGTGKTTLLLQKMKRDFPRSANALYMSLDHFWFKTHSVYDAVEAHIHNGGTHVFLDEVHYQKDWEVLIKNLYDDFPSLHIIYTGSSILKIKKAQADLSRRQIEYDLPGLSFSEYLEMEKVITIPPVSLDQILQEHFTLSMDITEKINILKHFHDYLNAGYYPFFKDIHSGYAERLQQIINQVLESDFPATENVSYATIQKTRKMLMILSESAPQTPNMERLYRELETDRNQGLKMLHVLSSADLLNLLSSDSVSMKNMSRPDKIYCDNPNLMYALCPSAEIGTIRETFFLNQLRAAKYNITYPKQGDFLINDRYLFEVGGKGKTFRQIKDLPNSYLAVDDIETGLGNRIPLWIFGMAY